jgi:hypothetical protein
MHSDSGFVKAVIPEATSGKERGMRKAMLLGASMVLALLLASGAALAATINGTGRADFLVGTRHADTIKALVGTTS